MRKEHLTQSSLPPLCNNFLVQIWLTLITVVLYILCAHILEDAQTHELDVIKLFEKEV